MNRGIMSKRAGVILFKRLVLLGQSAIPARAASQPRSMLGTVDRIHSHIRATLDTHRRHHGDVLSGALGARPVPGAHSPPGCARRETFQPIPNMSAHWLGTSFNRCPASHIQLPALTWPEWSAARRAHPLAGP